MELLQNISGYKNVCSLLKFGNRSWLGTPFSTPSYCYTSNESKSSTNRKEKADTFDFGDKLKVV